MMITYGASSICILHANNYFISISTTYYQQTTIDQMAGFYRSKYTDIHGNQKIMASTQFEALDARRCFPCFDEPALKSIFGITLVVPSELTALSNMPIQSCKSFVDDNGTTCTTQECWKEVVFMDSPIMSSYLVAFLVGEFDCLSGITNTGTVISVHAPPGQASKGQFALDVAIKCLEFYNDYFQVPYPMPKLDMVAIPEFAAGAMENWGLVTYRTVDLLITKGQASQDQMQRVCVVVCHELAHQWFGNLVTFAWWDDLWLNEGFASFMENYSIYKLFSQFNYIWDRFSSTGALAAALRLDALRSSHPIQVPIYHAEEVDQVFDAISYCKGACVVKMINAVLGKSAFQSGLKLYMDTYKYKNTETYHLWECWEKSSNGLPIGELMKSWTEQCGFPLLKVTQEEWKDTEVTLTFEQSWFLSDGSCGEAEGESKKLWCVPIFVLTESGILPSVTWMREEYCSVTIPLNSGASSCYIKLNANHDVPMRVQHTPTMLAKMADSIVNMTMPVSDRGGLLGDMYALLKANKLLHPKELFTLITYYKHETSPIVWEAMELIFLNLETITSQADSDLGARFRAFAKQIIMPLKNAVGWDPQEGEDHLAVKLRGTMVRLFAKFCSDEEDVINEVKSRFAKFLLNPDDVEALPSDIRSPVFKIVLKNGGVEEYESIKAYFYSAIDVAQKNLALGSLGFASDPALKQKTLDWALSGDVKLQDFFYPMGSVSGSSKEGLALSWAFLKDNLKTIKDKIGKASSALMDACIVSCCGSFCTDEDADMVEEFFKANPLPNNARKIAQTVENIRANAKLLESLQKHNDLIDEAFWVAL